jgi:transcriptional regulator with XRE-family HTH domain
LTPVQTEYFQFAERLAIAISDKGIKHSPTVLGKLFNQHFQGRPVTPHTARNWLLGKAMPTQEKLVCLAKLLDTSPEQLRFGRSSEKTLMADFDGVQTEVANVDQQFFKRYLALTEKQRRVVRDVVREFKPTGVA